MNRNELRQALEDAADTLITSTGLMVDQASPIWEAASAWLDLQPDKCECMSQHPDAREEHRFLKVACHGSGRVYKTETVDRIVRALRAFRLSRRPDETAIAVLDALNEAGVTAEDQ